MVPTAEEEQEEEDEEEEERRRRRRRRSVANLLPSSRPRRASTGADFRETGSFGAYSRLHHREKPRAEAARGGEERAKEEDEERRQASTSALALLG